MKRTKIDTDSMRRNSPMYVIINDYTTLAIIDKRAPLALLDFKVEAGKKEKLNGGPERPAYAIAAKARKKWKATAIPESVIGNAWYPIEIWVQDIVKIVWHSLLIWVRDIKGRYAGYSLLVWVPEIKVVNLWYSLLIWVPGIKCINQSVYKYGV